MSKKVLAIYFSQSGQLGEIIDNFCQPLIAAGNSVEKVQVRLKNEFPFPWTSERFFSVMPDCVQGITAELEPFSLQSTSYDLVILGYQAWFLSPSIPFNSLMHHPQLLGVLKNTPVITMTGARNMWVNAFDKIKKLILNAGANHVGTVALVDNHLNLVSIFTIFHWMLRGEKTRYLGFFPKPGVAAEDIAHTSTFGATTLPYLQKGEWTGLREALIEQKAVVPKFHLLFMEGKAGMMFKVWANIISKKKNRKPWLVAFKYYLLIALFIFAPIVFVVDRLIFRPFFPKYVKAKIASCLKLN
ncbi:MAG: hypothetical protein J0I41_22550 [Filimonas sp.]|nr:hypothetical protein [Filimonas sp.]